MTFIHECAHWICSCSNVLISDLVYQLFFNVDIEVTWFFENTICAQKAVVQLSLIYNARDEAIEHAWQEAHV